MELLCRAIFGAAVVGLLRLHEGCLAVKYRSAGSVSLPSSFFDQHWNVRFYSSQLLKLMILAMVTQYISHDFSHYYVQSPPSISTNYAKKNLEKSPVIFSIALLYLSDQSVNPLLALLNDMIFGSCNSRIASSLVQYVDS